MPEDTAALDWRLAWEKMRAQAEANLARAADEQELADKALESLNRWQARAERAEAALRKIEQIQPRVLGYIRANGFVFDDIGTEPGNWKHLAFSIYSDLCEADGIARAAIPTEEPER